MPLIIFVDDHEDDARLFQKAINEISNQCVVTLAQGSNEFFDLLEKVTPQYIFLDVVMPNEGGISCLKKIRDQRRYDGVPVIMISANHNIEPSVNEMGVDNFLPKPFNIDDLISIVAKHTQP